MGPLGAVVGCDRGREAGANCFQSPLPDRGRPFGFDVHVDALDVGEKPAAAPGEPDCRCPAVAAIRGSRGEARLFEPGDDLRCGLFGGPEQESDLRDVARLVTERQQHESPEWSRPFPAAPLEPLVQFLDDGAECHREEPRQRFVRRLLRPRGRERLAAVDLRLTADRQVRDATSGSLPAAARLKAVCAGTTIAPPAPTSSTTPSSDARAVPSRTTRISSRVSSCGTGWASGDSSTRQTLASLEPVDGAASCQKRVACISCVGAEGG